MNLYRSINSRSQLLLLLVILISGSLSCSRNRSPRVLIKTQMGDLLVEVYPDLAPVTSNNFLDHVEKGTYTNSIFYRVVRMDNQPQNKVKIEVIQGGLFDDDLIESQSPIEHETTEVSGILHTNGVISMARMGPGTASTEFFICIGNQPSLDWGGGRNPDGQGFAAFGKVIRGIEIAEAIQKLPDDNQYLIEKVVINEIILQ